MIDTLLYGDDCSEDFKERTVKTLELAATVVGKFTLLSDEAKAVLGDPLSSKLGFSKDCRSDAYNRTYFPNIGSLVGFLYYHPCQAMSTEEYEGLAHAHNIFNSQDFGKPRQANRAVIRAGNKLLKSHPFTTKREKEIVNKIAPFANVIRDSFFEHERKSKEVGSSVYFAR